MVPFTMLVKFSITFYFWPVSWQQTGGLLKQQPAMLPKKDIKKGREKPDLSVYHGIFFMSGDPA
jgi:hypothetical protein